MTRVASKFKTRSLRTNFSWTLVGNVVFAASQWGILVLVARLYSPEAVGIFTLGLALTAPVFMLSNLQLRSVQANDVGQDYSFKDYLTLRMSTTLLTLVALAFIIWSSDYRHVAGVLMYIALSKAFEAVSDVMYGSFQQQERMDFVSFSLMLRGILSVIAFAAVSLLSQTLSLGVAMMAFVWAMVLLFYDLPKARQINGRLEAEHKRFTKRISVRQLFHLALTALPLGITMMLQSLNTNIPRYFIDAQHGAYALGIFGALAYILVAGRTVVSALGQAAAPKLARAYYYGHQQKFRALAIKLMLIGVALGLAGIMIAAIFGKDLLTLLYGAEYARYTSVFNQLMLAAALTYVASFGGYIISAAKYFRIQTPMALARVITALLLSWLLIPRYGIYGGALAITLSSAVQLSLNLWVWWLADRALLKRSKSHYV